MHLQLFLREYLSLSVFGFPLSIFRFRMDGFVVLCRRRSFLCTDLRPGDADRVLGGVPGDVGAADGHGGQVPQGEVRASECCCCCRCSCSWLLFSLLPLLLLLLLLLMWLLPSWWSASSVLLPCCAVVQ